MRGRLSIILLTTLLTAAAGVLTELATATPPEWLQPVLPYSWPLLGLSLLGLVWLEARRLFAEREAEQPDESTEQHNRRVMLASVKAQVTELRRDTLADAVEELTLNLRTQPDAVRPCLRFRQPSSSVAIAHGAPVLDVFDHQGGALLILGEPGAGKTTVLLELAQQLVARAEADPSTPFRSISTSPPGP